MKFQSTLPARGATIPNVSGANVVDISIHAPRTGSDIHGLGYTNLEGLFQSTLPARGATSALCGR